MLLVHDNNSWIGSIRNNSREKKDCKVPQKKNDKRKGKKLCWCIEIKGKIYVK